MARLQTDALREEWRAKLLKSEVDLKIKKFKTFSEAFKMAKGQKTFTFKGKSYARVTKDELDKKGFKSLRAYLNSMKGTRVAKK